MANPTTLKVRCPHCDAMVFPDVFANSIEPDARVPHLLPIRVVALCPSCSGVIGQAYAMIEAKWSLGDVDKGGYGVSPI